jgi:hypothetical protein
MSIPEQSPEQSPNASPRTRTCYRQGCTETLSYQNGQQITELFAIELAHWLTVMGESLQPVLDAGKVVGFRVVPSVKTFCSTECLKGYIDGIVAEYKEAESRVLRRKLLDNTPSAR